MTQASYALHKAVVRAMQDATHGLPRVALDAAAAAAIGVCLAAERERIGRAIDALVEAQPTPALLAIIADLSRITATPSPEAEFIPPPWYVETMGGTAAEIDLAERLTDDARGGIRLPDDAIFAPSSETRVESALRDAIARAMRDEFGTDWWTSEMRVAVDVVLAEAKRAIDAMPWDVDTCRPDVLAVLSALAEASE